MEDLELAYCNECEDLVEFSIQNETVEEEFKGIQIRYQFPIGRCNCCNCEVATDIDYNARKSGVKIEAYKRAVGIIDLHDISEILAKYDIGKEALADISGFGKVTIKRYYDGYIPAREYSDILVRILNEEKFFIELVETNRDKLKDVAYRKIIARYARLMEIDNSKIDQIANYLLIHIGEVTPLALEKLLYFSNGVNYALNGKRLIPEESQAWAHGPVYPQMYNRYRKYGYKPIDDGINSTHGCLTSKLTCNELKAIDLVINTFGLYSPKTLERISHSQKPWKEKRIGYKDEEAGREVIDERSIKAFYTDRQLNSEETIIAYILSCTRQNCVE